MWTGKSEFNYEAPELKYDSKTGDIKVIEKKKVQKKIIRTPNDLEHEKEWVYKENGLTDEPDLSTTEE